MLLDKIGSLLFQVYQNPSTSIQAALVPAEGVLISKVVTNQADLVVHISFSSCLSELIHITTPNSPFGDDPMKKALQVIMSTF